MAPRCAHELLILTLWAHFIIVVDVAGSRCSDGDDALFPSYFAETVNISAQLRSAIVVIVVLLVVVDRLTFRWPFGKQFRPINWQK